MSEREGGGDFYYPDLENMTTSDVLITKLKFIQPSKKPTFFYLFTTQGEKEWQAKREKEWRGHHTFHAYRLKPRDIHILQTNTIRITAAENGEEEWDFGD